MVDRSLDEALAAVAFLEAMSLYEDTAGALRDWSDDPG